MSGASLGAAAVLVLGSAALAGLGVSAAAFVGALLALVLVFVLGRHGGRFSPPRLVLAGVALAYALAPLHDLNLAAACCDRLYVLAGGRMVARGPIAEVLTAALLAEVFGVRAHCGPHPVTGHLHVAYLPPPELNGHPLPRSAITQDG